MAFVCIWGPIAVSDEVAEVKKIQLTRSSVSGIPASSLLAWFNKNSGMGFNIAPGKWTRAELQTRCMNLLDENGYLRWATPNGGRRLVKPMVEVLPGVTMEKMSSEEVALASTGRGVYKVTFDGGTYSSPRAALNAAGLLEVKGGKLRRAMREAKGKPFTFMGKNFKQEDYDPELHTTKEDE